MDESHSSTRKTKASEFKLELNSFHRLLVTSPKGLNYRRQTLFFGSRLGVPEEPEENNNNNNNINLTKATCPQLAVRFFLLYASVGVFISLSKLRLGDYSRVRPDWFPSFSLLLLLKNH